MKIIGSVRAQYQHQMRTSTRPERPAGHAAKAERVDVSSTAQTLSSARAAETPDASRVERLRGAIADGSFEIDVDRIAEQMLLEEIE